MSLLSYGDQAALRVRTITSPEQNPDPDGTEVFVELIDVDAGELVDEWAQVQLERFNEDRWRSRYEQQYLSWGADSGSWQLLIETALSLAEATVLLVELLERRGGTRGSPLPREEALEHATYRASARWSVDRQTWSVVQEYSDDGDRRWVFTLVSPSEPSAVYEVGLQRAGQCVVQTHAKRSVRR